MSAVPIDPFPPRSLFDELLILCARIGFNP